jgi:chromodomain-helicase-DNA-binding protein 1
MLLFPLSHPFTPFSGYRVIFPPMNSSASSFDEEDEDLYQSESEEEIYSDRPAKKARTIKRNSTILTDSEDEESYAPRTKKKPKKVSVKKSHKFSLDDLPSDEEETEEEISYELEDDQEEEAPIESYAYQETEAATETIDLILLPDETSKPIDIKSAKFLIKWTGKSYIHCTWETFASLSAALPRGTKKVTNFVRNFNESFEQDPEQLAFQIENNRALIETFKQPERLIAVKKDSYLVKWNSLGYDQCTWESSLVLANHMQMIDEFLNRESSQKVPGKGKFPTFTGQRQPFKKLESQPAFLSHTPGLELRDYQLEGLNWLSFSWTKNNNVILADEMGLGKTIQSASFISWLFHERNIFGPFLIVVPLSTLGSWQKELQKWIPNFNVVVFNGNAAARDVIVENEFWQKSSKMPKFNILLTTFEMATKEVELLGQVNWALLAVDEAHRLKNVNSQIHESLSSFRTINRLLITGTPLQNSIKELWCLLNFLMPQKFHDWENFEAEYATISQESQVNSLHEELRPHILRRMKKDVEKSMPSKSERILRVELAPSQQKLYRWILTKNYKELNKGVNGKQASLMNVMGELKKASNHAFFFESVENEQPAGTSRLNSLIENSGKMILLDKLLVCLKADGHRVLIFSQMIKVLDLIAEYLTLKRYQFQRLDGSTGNESRKKSIEHFNAPGSIDFCFLLSTRAGGLGINLETADTVIIFDSDWNPQNDLQAMARAHRIGQKNSVNIYRFVSKGTIEEEILERAKKKMVLDHVIIQRLDQSASTSASVFSKGELQSILQFGAQNMFLSDVQSGASTNTINLDDILERAESHGTTEESVNDEFLGQFKVADFGTLASWSDIIPRAEIEQQETEEIVDRERQLYESMIERKKQKAAAMKAIKKEITPEASKARVEFDLADEKTTRAIIKQSLTFGIPCDPKEKQIVQHLLTIKEHVLLGNTGISFNAPLFGKRIEMLGKLKEHFTSLKCPLPAFRITTAGIKPVGVKWCEGWGIREDSMILAGIYKHGYGNWEVIFADAELSLPKDQMEKGALKPDQLNRRADYLGSVFERPKKSEKRPEKEPKEKNQKKESKPQPEPGQKAEPKEKKPTLKERPPHSLAVEKPAQKKQQKLTEIVPVKELMKPVKEYLQKLGALETPDVTITCECIKEIGKHISQQSSDVQGKLWKFVTNFWFTTEVTGEELKGLYEKILSKE